MKPHFRPFSSMFRRKRPDEADHIPQKLRRRRKIVAAFFVLLHIGGAASSLDAILETRTPQGAVAWVVSLNTMPIAALPAYWIFGRSDFNGYVHARQQEDEQLAAQIQDFRDTHPELFSDAGQHPDLGAVERLIKLPTLRGNQVELLIDGTATFDSILEGIDAAEDYVLVEFFIVKDDDIGRRFQQALISKAREGVEVAFLYDEVGSHALPERYLRELREAGVQARNFHTRKGPNNRFQINFRNHRKIVVVDGHTAWIGGHNVGDEYLDGGKEFSAWRDTHIRIQGPAVLPVQLTFIEDWNWATDSVFPVSWEVPSSRGDHDVLIVPTGPADTYETGALLFTHAINSAQHRLWIGSPYFIPDQGLLQALQLAVFRGVDVRILLPDDPDHLLPYLAAYSFVEALGPGVTIYRYTKGFMHQKVLLVDDHTAAVGTANFDNRSFRLNFEITAVVLNKAFTAQVAAMLEQDFANGEIMPADAVNQKHIGFRLLSRAAALTAPTL
jgi:cardiolipin synthase